MAYEPRKPIAGSRPSASRPRRLAGSGRPDEPVEEVSRPEPTKPAAPPAKPPGPTPPRSSAPDREPSHFLASLRTTWVLVAAVVVLALVSAGEIGWLVTRGDPVVSASRPVV